MDLDREDPGSLQASAPRRTEGIRAAGLTKSFKAPQGIVRAVRGIDLTIPIGQTMALLGPNGAGKSTTIDMMLGLSAPDAGSVSVLGGTPQEAVDAGLVSAMLQAGALIRDVNVRELVGMVAALYPRPMAVGDVLELVGIADLGARRTQKLSGGQTQRVRLAVALVADPQLLILDEPTVAMDVEGRHGFWAAMRAFTARGRTVIFATHYLEEADDNADRIVLMAHGQIVADGAPTEIKARVGRRTIRATLVDVAPERLRDLPGVAAVDRHGDTVSLNCTDSDAAIRALLGAYPAAHHIEIAGAGLEEAFLELTGDEDVPAVGEAA
ncbi:MAG TPA: ABC transporter ATP-binding protein [Solirubrobacteraceae bacterium]|nr:ABC transporter ATP-binding protein [Solirubrobacteraceae bacterium]